MAKSIDLKNDPVKKLFYYYLFSAVTGNLVKSLHMVLDGVFVGNGVGAGALAAVNIAMPASSFMSALIFMIGVGGSTLVSMRFGEGDERSARSIFLQSRICMVAVSVVGQILFLANSRAICMFLGANEAVLDYTIEYATYIMYFLPFTSLALGVSIFVRNDADPKVTMYSMVLSALSNAIMNYIFIFPMNMGLKGAAIATGIAQIVGCVVLSWHFIGKKGRLRLNFKGFAFSGTVMGQVVRVGIPSFVGEISFAVISLVFNRIIINIGGELAVSAFSIMMYVTALMYMVFYGIGHAMQPIISFCYGARDYGRIYECYHLAVRDGLILGVLFTIAGIIFLRPIVMLFNATDQALISMAMQANFFLFLTFACAAYCIVIGTFFQAVGNARVSSVIQVFRGFLVNVILILFFSRWWGLLGVWLVYPVGEVISLVLCLWFMKYKQDIVGKVY